jgi:hypothetical protein
VCRGVCHRDGGAGHSLAALKEMIAIIANCRAALDAAMPLCLRIVYQWRGASERGCYE